MKHKIVFVLVLFIFINKSFSQLKVEKDIIGVWQVININYENFYEYNFESKKATLKGMMLWQSEEDGAKTKAEIEGKAKILYLGFNDNQSFVFFSDVKSKKGTYEIAKSYSEGLYNLELNSDKRESWKLSIDDSNLRQLVIEQFDEEAKQAGVDSKLILTFKKLNEKEMALLKNDINFKKFETSLAISKNEKAKQDKISNENRIINAKEDQEEADRLSKEHINSKKLYRSNLDLMEAVELINEKFAQNKILEIIKNEKMNADFGTNLYKSTLSIKNTQLIYVRDYKGQKTIVVNIDSADQRDALLSKYYECSRIIEAWAKKKGGFSKGTGWDDIVFTSNNLKIDIHLYSSDKYVLEITFSQ